MQKRNNETKQKVYIIVIFVCFIAKNKLKIANVY